MGKRVPLMLSSPSTVILEQRQSGTVRFPVTLAPTVRRWRLHAANVNGRFGRRFQGTVRVQGVFAGRTDAARSDLPVRIAEEGLVSAGGHWSSPWTDLDVGSDVPHMISVGWFRQGEVGATYTGCLRSDDPAEAEWPLPGRIEKTCPLTWWVEAVIDDETPVVAMWGDSHTVGTGATLPVHDSPLSVACRQLGAAPLHFAYPGTGLAPWAKVSAATWEWWSDYPRPDLVVHAMGRNDVSQHTLAREELRARFDATWPLLRERLCPGVVLWTITPSENDDDRAMALAADHNDWLRDGLDGRPGIAGLVDAARVAADPARSGRPLRDLMWDSTTFSSEGCAVLGFALRDALGTFLG